MPTISNIEAGSHVEWAGFLDEKAVFALADGSAVIAHGGETRVRLNEGLTVAAADPDRKSLVAGGEDGSLTRLRSDGVTQVLRFRTGRWVDAIACGRSDMVAAASGRNVTVIARPAREREIACERTAEGLAFAPRGVRLALARYNGVELIWVGTDTRPQFLEWKGAHNAVSFSPDGRFIVTAMQENALHGWRLADARNMRMSGYPAKTRSLSWTAKGNWLASSGAPAAIVWPFSGKDGPMGKAPLELGAMGKVMVTEVACHPREEVVAIGYENGMIVAARIADGKEAVLRREGFAPITRLGWDAGGRRIAFGSGEGEAGIIDIAG